MIADGDPSPGGPDGGLGYALAQAAHRWRRALAEELKPFGITPPQFFVLASLYRMNTRRSHPPTQRELAERVAMDPNTASQVIRGLERQGIIRRERHPADSRAVTLALSEEGQRLARRATAAAREVNQRFFAASDRATLRAELDKLP